MDKALTANLSPLSPQLSILLFPSAAYESLMSELGCWLISHLCANSIDRLPADCWAGWDGYWVCSPSLTVSLPFFFSLSFCFTISQQHQKCFNRALMASAPNLTSSTHSPKHTKKHTHILWVENSLLVVGKKVLNRKKRGRDCCSDGGWHAPLFSPPAPIFLPSTRRLTWPACTV